MQSLQLPHLARRGEKPVTFLAWCGTFSEATLRCVMVERPARHSEGWMAFDPFETFIRDTQGVFFGPDGSVVFELSDDPGKRGDQRGLWLQCRIAAGLLNLKTRADFDDSEIDWAETLEAYSSKRPDDLYREQSPDGVRKNRELFVLLYLQAKDPREDHLELFVPYLAVQALKEFDEALGYVMSGSNGGVACTAMGSLYLSFATQCAQLSGREIVAREIGRKGAVANFQEMANQRWAADPTRDDWQMIRSCFEQWQKNPANYSGVPAFAQDMLNKVSKLKSGVYIERRVRDWIKALNST